MKLTPLQIWQAITTMRNLSKAQWGKFIGVVLGVAVPAIFAAPHLDHGTLYGIVVSAGVAALGWLDAQSQDPVIGKKADAADDAPARARL